MKGEDKIRNIVGELKVSIELLIQLVDDSIIQINKFQEVNKNERETF
jgi:hypothetical protein